VRRAVLAPHGRTCTLGFPGCELTGAHVSEEADSRGGDVRSETRIQQSGCSAAAGACDRGAHFGGKEDFSRWSVAIGWGRGGFRRPRGGGGCAMKMRRVPETHKGPAPLMRGLFLSPRGVVTTARVCVCTGI